MLVSLHAERLAKKIREYLQKDQGKLILDLENVKASEDKALETLANKLRTYRRRIRIRLPKNYLDHAAQFLLLAQIFRLHRGRSTASEKEKCSPARIVHKIVTFWTMIWKNLMICSIPLPPTRQCPTKNWKGTKPPCVLARL